MLTLNEIKELMDKMAETNLGEVKIKDGDFKLKLVAKKPPEITHSNCESPQITIETTATSLPTPVIQPIIGNIVKSPIVGTFYTSAAPSKPAFVTVGQQVKKGDVLFVIESMKLMNEIQSAFDGEVVEIKVENEQGIEYGQHIMTIR